MIDEYSLSFNISEEHKGEGELIWGGGVKREFTVFTFDVLVMNVFSLCHICLRQSEHI